MTVTVDSLTPAAQTEAATLGLVNPLEPLPSEIGFPDWFVRIEENFRRVAVAECEALFEHYQGHEAGDLDRFRECKASFCFDPMVERLCIAHQDDLRGLLHRRVELFLGHLTHFRIAGHPQAAELQSSLENRFFKFRAPVGDQPRSFGQLNQLIKNSPDRAEREAAWKAFLPLSSESAETFRALVQVRNQLARDLGYRDVVDMRWKLSEIDETWMLGLLDQLERETQAPYDAMLAELKANLGVETLEIWDISYAVERISPLPPEAFEKDGADRRLKALLHGWGFGPAEADIPSTFCDNFGMGGVCFGIEPGREVKILLSPVNGARFYRTYFHEYGHALHFRHAGQQNVLLNEEDMAFNEGMAVFFEAMVSDPDWVQRELGLSDSDTEQFCKQARYATLAWMRSLLVLIRFEHALYSDPGCDPSRLYRELQRRCCGVELPEGGEWRWAADQMYASHPLYYHNYLIAELITRQTREAILARDGDLLDNPRIREFLHTNYYQPGASLPWGEKIARATGKPLDGEAFFRFLNRKS